MILSSLKLEPYSGNRNVLLPKMSTLSFHIFFFLFCFDFIKKKIVLSIMINEFEITAPYRWKSIQNNIPHIQNKCHSNVKSLFCQIHLL